MWTFSHACLHITLRSIENRSDLNNLTTQNQHSLQSWLDACCFECDNVIWNRCICTCTCSQDWGIKQWKHFAYMLQCTYYVIRVFSHIENSLLLLININCIFINCEFIQGYVLFLPWREYGALMQAVLDQHHAVYLSFLKEKNKAINIHNYHLTRNI